MAIQSRITLTPKAIRKAVIAQLALRGVAGGNIYSTRHRHFTPSEAPAVNVFSNGSSDSSASKHIPRFKHVERVVCAGTVTLAAGLADAAVSEAIGDAVDDLEAAIKAALLTSRLFAASFEIEGIATEKGVSTEGEAVRGFVTIQFSFVYTEQLTVDEEPTAPDALFEEADFDVVASDGTVRANLRPIWRVKLVTHNGDNLITHVLQQLITHASQGFDGAGA